jgi:NAD(P)-dependent dehydrogenase (short-subunit alcohol dehydrogenase family)
VNTDCPKQQWILAFFSPFLPLFLPPTALNRYGHVDDIAAMVAFVAGPEASYITGASLTVDGGYSA